MTECRYIVGSQPPESFLPGQGGKMDQQSQTTGRRCGEPAYSESELRRRDALKIAQQLLGYDLSKLAMYEREAALKRATLFVEALIREAVPASPVSPPREPVAHASS